MFLLLYIPNSHFIILVIIIGCSHQNLPNYLTSLGRRKERFSIFHNKTEMKIIAKLNVNDWAFKKVFIFFPHYEISKIAIILRNMSCWPIEHIPKGPRWRLNFVKAGIGGFRIYHKGNLVLEVSSLVFINTTSNFHIEKNSDAGFHNSWRFKNYSF